MPLLLLSPTPATATRTGTVNTGTASKLLFGQQPTNTVIGETIAPPVTVQVTDALNNGVTTDTRSVTIAIGTNPSGGALSGTTTVAAVAGVATFSNLSINNAGTGYTLLATSAPALTGATSAAFNITAGSQTITFGALAAKTSGDADFGVSATASSGLTAASRA